MEEKYYVLIAEDSAINQRILQKILEKDYHLELASNGAEAVRKLGASPDKYAALILDLKMPEMDGFEVMGYIKDHLKIKNLPILVETEEHNSKTEARCFALGAWDFVRKPYEPATLKARLANIIARGQANLMKRIKSLAERDTLTGLYNRSFFMDQTVTMVTDHPEMDFAMVRLDIDRFRMYNSFFGKDAGDELLKLMANVLGRVCELIPMCTYGRIESDIFCICEPYEDTIISNQLEFIKGQLPKMSEHYRLGISCGISVIRDHGHPDMENIYAQTTEAAKTCKGKYNRYYAFYNESMHEKNVKAQKISNEMERALANEEFKVFIQPKYALSNDKPCGGEALVRWFHGEEGIISPGEFIPVFEQNGFIIQLDYYMWDKVCALLRKWLDAGCNPDPVSVNISRVSFYDPHILDHLFGLIDKYKIPASLLYLEVTESAYMSNPHLMAEIIAQLHKKGFIIMMDDFGSGYSSLNTLKDIDVDILKIDMKFLPTGHDNVKSEKILASITRMAGWLGMPVVVEGVETKEQRDFLESIGSGYVQGYFFARPMPAEDYERTVVKLSELVPMDTVEEGITREELDSLWASDGRVSTLLKSITIPFAIFEYSDFQCDILRMNDAFIRTFNPEDENGIWNKEGMEIKADKLIDALKKTVTKKSTTECELCFQYDKSVRWFMGRLKYIATVAKTDLISGTFSEITMERRLEGELNKIYRAISDVDSAHGGKKPAMLVVDDSDIGRGILKNMFSDRYEVLTAANGQEGLDVLSEKSEKILIILLDLNMPVMDGWEFLKQKNRMGTVADIPVIVVSSENSEEVQLNMLKNGVNDYITKPYVPEVVKQRIQNVLEYNGRFRALVREYNNVQTVMTIDDEEILVDVYSAPKICHLIAEMGKIFDVVRLVNPDLTAVMDIDEEGHIESTPYSCFCVWNKDVRCENCTSARANRMKKQLVKYEFVEDNVFYVISRPIVIKTEDGVEVSCVLEIVSKVSDILMMQRICGNTMKDFISDIQKKIYTDGLTGVFNRRYYDEMLFLHRGRNDTSRQITFILLDMCDFKRINDEWGHTVGDEVLVNTAKALAHQVRDVDSVIRFGGDEFLIVLTECEKVKIPDMMDRLKKAVNTVRFGKDRNRVANASIGFSHTVHFLPNSGFMKRMFDIADKAMYEDKKKWLEGYAKQANN